MLSVLCKTIKDASVVRRLEYAASFYPRSMPSYWERVASFSLKTKEDRNTLAPDQARQFVENIEVVDNGAFASDIELTREMMEKQGEGMPHGIVVISQNESCLLCGSRLYIKADCTLQVAVYDNSFRSVPGTHYTKYCRKKGCSFQQHYGYHTSGNMSGVTYDLDRSTLRYFLSTRETAFSMEMLHRLDREILFGQISYKQRAEIYSDIHYCGKDVSLVHVHMLKCDWVSVLLHCKSDVFTVFAAPMNWNAQS